MKQCDLIISGAFILTMKDDEIIQNGSVAISDGQIKEVREKKFIEKHYLAKHKIEKPDCLIMPGLINTHTHAAMSYFRGLADDLPLDIWLKENIWPAEASFVNENFVKNAGNLACLEMIKNGVTCFNDMYFFTQMLATSVKESKMRAVLGEVIFDFPGPNTKNAFSGLSYSLDLLQEFADDNLINISINPHSVYACKEKTLVACARLATENNLPLHIHLSETKKEIKETEKKFALSPIELTFKLGLLNNRTIAAHCLYLSDVDKEILRKNKVKISHCPISNAKLGSGVASIPELINRYGITVGLGTDGAASNNNLSVFKEVRFAALLHKVIGHNPELLSAKQALRMATINGANTLGLGEKIGSLEKGKDADLIAVKINKVHGIPVYDLFSLLVYAVNDSDVDLTMVKGRILMDKRDVKTLNEEKIIDQAKDFAKNYFKQI